MAAEGSGPTHTIGRGLVRLAFAVEAAYTRASRERGLTAQQCELLCTVGFDVLEDGRWVPAERGTPVGDLAAQLNCDQSNVSRLVDRAVARGLLERRRGLERDRRVTLVELTTRGRRELDRFIAELMRALDPLFADWPADRKRQALATVNSLADVLERAEDRHQGEGGRRAP